MRRIDAKSRKARAVLVRFSKSLASRRHLPSQANVLSTTHRLGMTSKPTAVSDRLTISVSKWCKIFFRAWSNTRPLVSAVGKEFLQKRKPAEQGSEDQNAAIAVLDIGWMHDGVQQQAYRVDKDVALLTFDLLTRIVARRIDAGPPFSAPFTL